MLTDRILNQYLPVKSIRPSTLHKAMRYSVFAGGKRLRSILCLAAAEAVSGSEKKALFPAAAIELLHTYTLIHDDLPAMDNDDLRRGKPTCHIVFGEANAILAGDALLTMAFEWLARCQPPSPYKPNQLALELARAAGSQGVIGGQVEDLAAENKKPNAKLVEYIHQHKTAVLIRAAVRIGAIVSGASRQQLRALTLYGEKVGLAFQIADDILNETSDKKTMGKSAGSDKERGKLTYVAVYGLKESKARAAKLANQAILALKKAKIQSEPLDAIAQYTVSRTN